MLRGSLRPARSRGLTAGAAAGWVEIDGSTRATSPVSASRRAQRGHLVLVGQQDHLRRAGRAGQQLHQRELGRGGDLGERVVEDERQALAAGAQRAEPAEVADERLGQRGGLVVEGGGGAWRSGRGSTARGGGGRRSRSPRGGRAPTRRSRRRPAGSSARRRPGGPRPTARRRRRFSVSSIMSLTRPTTYPRYESAPASARALCSWRCTVSTRARNMKASRTVMRPMARIGTAMAGSDEGDGQGGDQRGGADHRGVAAEPAVLLERRLEGVVVVLDAGDELGILGGVGGLVLAHGLELVLGDADTGRGGPQLGLVDLAEALDDVVALGVAAEAVAVEVQRRRWPCGRRGRSGRARRCGRRGRGTPRSRRSRWSGRSRGGRRSRGAARRGAGRGRRPARG